VHSTPCGQKGHPALDPEKLLPSMQGMNSSSFTASTGLTVGKPIEVLQRNAKKSH
jgi:hypothetical protein